MPSPQRLKLRYHAIGNFPWTLMLDGRVGRAILRDTRFLLHVAQHAPEDIQGTLVADVTEVQPRPGERDFVVTRVHELRGPYNRLLYRGEDPGVGVRTRAAGHS